MSRFFIDRPIFAWVIAIVIMLAGVLAITALPVSQYPNIAPPQISISAMYPGASAETIEKTVVQLIEQNMKGLDGLMYMSSSSDSSGSAQINLTFTAGTNPDTAQVQVQNKLQLATPRLPVIVQRAGITVAKATPNFLMVLGFVSENGQLNDTDLADYVATNLLDPISRVDGVGSVQLFGSPYAMRIWLDPIKLHHYKLVPADVAAAVSAQNAEITAGQLGGTPAIPGQRFSVTVTAQSLLRTPEQFGNIVLRTLNDGSSIRLRDVAKVEVGQEQYSAVSRYNGKPATGVAVNLSSGANALKTSRAVRERLGELEKFFPPGMTTVYPFDTTPFVQISIREVITTLAEAVALVFLVMYLFLQNFRATLIPTIAVPVVLLGTFGILFAFGFSINTLTMFAMVLAIGLLVDDAIVVVENVERVMNEEGLDPKKATQRSMQEITGALVGIGLVLSAVFIPMAFFSGSTGVIYRQFSITIVSAMGLSVLVAMILTPALCVTFLRPANKDHLKNHRGFFGWFNRQFDRNTNRYQSTLRKILGRSTRFSWIYLGLVGVMAGLYIILPTAFMPDEDQGVIFSQIQLPPGATQESTIKVLHKVEEHFLRAEAANVESIFSIAGFSFGGSGQNSGLAFIQLKDWDQRRQPEQNIHAVAGRAMAAFSQLREAMVFAFAPPAVMDLGNATGFDFQLLDQGGVGHARLMEARNQLLQLSTQHPDLRGVRPNGMDDTPQFRLTIDPVKAGSLGLAMSDINDVLTSAWGSQYLNDFLDRGRTKKVYMQGDASFRMQAEHLNHWYVRNKELQMVPFSAFSSSQWDYGSPRLERFQGVSSVEIMGEPAPGKSSGVAMQAMEQLANQLPPGIGYAWTGLSYQERLAGSQSTFLYAISSLVVFLCLAALYESWSVPFSVMLVVPLGVIGAVLATLLTGQANDVYFQVGLLTTIGLATKNAILIVEFAKSLQEQGMTLMDATVQAAHMRLRPILMTSIAFGFGVLPLALSHGAGSGAQNAIGVGVLGGMLASTVLGIFLIPLFFLQIRRYFSPTPSAAGERP